MWIPRKYHHRLRKAGHKRCNTSQFFWKEYFWTYQVFPGNHRKVANILWERSSTKKAIEVTIWHPKNRALGFSVYDSNNKTAYELKVSCKNPRNQFYKAICKALLMNSLPNQGKSIKKLIFMVSSEGEKNLYGTENGSPGNSLPAQMCQMRKLGFKIKIEKI